MLPNETHSFSALQRMDEIFVDFTGTSKIELQDLPMSSIEFLSISPLHTTMDNSLSLLKHLVLSYIYHTRRRYNLTPHSTEQSNRWIFF